MDYVPNYIFLSGNLSGQLFFSNPPSTAHCL